jgi:hypothetical protein
MAELPRYRPLGVSIPSVPTVDFVSAGRAQGDVYRSLGKSLDTMVEYVYKKQVDQAKISGAEMGATQPESVLERLRDQKLSSMGIEDRAAYETAVEALGLKVEVAARKKMGEISLLAAQENFTPQQLEQELNDASTGFADSISLLSPMAAVKMNAKLNNLKDAEVLGFSKQFLKDQKIADQAQGLEGLDMIADNLETMARSGMADFDLRLEEELADTAVYMAHQGFDPDDIAKQTIALRGNALKARLRGMFDDADGPSEQAIVINQIQKDLEEGGELTRGLDDKSASSVISEFTTARNAELKAVKTKVTSLKTDVNADVKAIVNKGAVPTAGVIAGFRAKAKKLAADGGDVSEILDILDNAESDADFVATLKDTPTNELTAMRNALAQKQYEGATSSDLLRLSAVKQRLSEAETQSSDIKKALKPVSAAVKRETAELEKVINDFKPVPDGAFDNIDRAVTILDASNIEGADVMAAELSQLKNRAQLYEKLRSASPNDLAVVRAELIKISDAEGTSPEINRQINAVDSRIRAQETALKSDPISWAKETGVVSPNNMIADLTGKTVSERLEIYKARSQEADIFADKMGRSAKYLDTNEAATLTNEFKESNVEGKLALIAEISNGFGVNSPKVFGEISKDAPEVAHVAGLINMGAKAQTAKDALRGLELMSDGIVLRVSGQKTNATERARARIGNMSRSPSTMKGILLTADAIYAARSGGEETFNAGMYDTALQEAAGMLTASNGQAFGGIVEYKGNGIVIPTNIVQDSTTFGKDVDLEDVIKKMTEEDLMAAGGGSLPMSAAGEVNFERLKNQIDLVQKDDGSVAVRFERDGDIFGLTTPSGDEYTIDLRILAQSVIDKRVK